MKTISKILIATLLIFNGAGAIYGGGNLMAYPDGSSIQLSMQWLEQTPFHNYLIPGIILFICNGVFSAFVLAALLLDHKSYPLLVIAQGLILICWIVIQMLMIQTVYFLHYVMGGAGLLLILLGWLSVSQMKQPIHGAQ